MKSAVRWGTVPAVPLVAAALVLAGCGSASDGGARAPVAAEPASTALEAAVDTCEAGLIADSGHTLMVDTKGEDDTTGESMEDLVCLLLALETPTAVIDHMSSTRALDGMQTNSWDEFDARWTYHPDAGMGLTITIRN